MPQKAWSAKRERQYEHIKESAKERGVGTKRAKEIAARTVNKERARSGEARQRSRTSTRDISSGRRGGLRSHRGPGGRTREQLYNEAKQLGIKGRSKMNKAQLLCLESESVAGQHHLPARERDEKNPDEVEEREDRIERGAAAIREGMHGERQQRKPADRVTRASAAERARTRLKAEARGLPVRCFSASRARDCSEVNKVTSTRSSPTNGETSPTWV